MKPSHPLYFLQESFTRPAPDGRTAYIDLIKGVCIIFMILHHCFLELVFDFSFTSIIRIPLFFFVSGLFFRTYDSYPTFFIKKFNNLIVPLMFWLLIPMLVQLRHFGFNIVELLRYHSFEIIRLNMFLWFLIALFFVNNIFYFFNKLAEKSSRNLKNLMVFGLVCLGTSISIYHAVNDKDVLPLWLDSALMSLPFFYIGFLLQDSKFAKNDSVLSTKYSVLLGIALISISFWIFHTHDNLQLIMKINRVAGEGGALLAYLNSFIFLFGLIFICKVAQWLPILSYFGRYSIIVLCTHILFITVVHKYLPNVFGITLPVEFNSLIVFLCCWIAIPVCRRFVPWFVAQKPLITSGRKPKVVLSEQ